MSLPTTPNTSQGLFMTPLKTACRVGGGGVAVGGASSSRRRVTTIIVNEEFGGGGDTSEEGGGGAVLSHSEGDVHDDASASTHSLKSPTAAASRVSSGGAAGSHNNKGILNHNGRLSIVNPDIHPPHTVYTNSFGLTIAERQHIAASDASNYFASMGYGSPYPLQPCTEGTGATDGAEGSSSQHIVVNSVGGGAFATRSSNSSWALNSSSHAQQNHRGTGDGIRGGGGGRLSHSSVFTNNNNTSLAGMEDLVNAHSNVSGSTSSNHIAHSTQQNNQGESATNVPISQRKEIAPLSTATALSPMRMPALMGAVGNPQRPLSSLSVSALVGLSGLGGTDIQAEGKHSPLTITANNNNFVSRLGGTSLLLLSPSAAALAAGGGVAGRSPSSLSTCSGQVLRSSSHSHRRGLGVVRRGSPAFLTPSDADAMSTSADAAALRGTLLSNRSLRGALRSGQRGGGGAKATLGQSNKGEDEEEEDEDSDIDGSPARAQRHQQRQRKKDDTVDEETDDEEDDDEGSISDLSRDGYCSSDGDRRTPNATDKGAGVTSSVGSTSGSALRVSRRINAIIQGADDDDDDI